MFDVFRRILKTTFATILLVLSLTSSLAAENVTKTSGGSIKTALGYGIVLNRGSSLTREWITIHDTSIPADISGTAGVTTIYDSGERYSSGSYQYSAEYSVISKEALSAVEVRFLIFDIWGNHSRTLSATDIVDMAAGSTKKFDGKWNIYSENEASEYYA